jgi:hypothetical protein
MAYPPWNDPPTSLAYYDNIPVQYPPPPGFQATKPSVPGKNYYAKLPMDMDVVHISLKSDVDDYLVPSLTSNSIPVMTVVDNENPNCPPGDPASLQPVTVWQGTAISGEAFTELRRPWIVALPTLPPPEGQNWMMMPNCQVLLEKMMAHGIGAPGYWSVITDKNDPRYVTAMMETSGLWWTFI